jgi:hypothetical protein
MQHLKHCLDVSCTPALGCGAVRLNSMQGRVAVPQAARLPPPRRPRPAPRTQHGQAAGTKGASGHMIQACSHPSPGLGLAGRGSDSTAAGSTPQPDPDPPRRPCECRPSPTTPNPRPAACSSPAPGTRACGRPVSAHASAPCSRWRWDAALPAQLSCSRITLRRSCQPECWACPHRVGALCKAGARAHTLARPTLVLQDEGLTSCVDSVLHAVVVCAEPPAAQPSGRSAPTPSSASTSTCTVVCVNPGFEALTGISSHAAAGRQLLSLLQVRGGVMGAPRPAAHGPWTMGGCMRLVWL